MVNTEEMARDLKELKNNFFVGDPVLEEIHDADNRELLGLSDYDFTLFAHMSARYEGEPPESYRVLNAFILDMVTDHREDFNTDLAKPVIDYLNDHYSDGDLSELQDGIDDFIWESQIDYIPMLDPENKRIYFDIELILVMESTED